MFDFDQDFPKADPVQRGCGDREPGGVYAECGLSSRGRPLKEFLIDPPLPIPSGLDLVNKPQTWQRMLPSGEPSLDVEGLPIYDLLIWVGAEHYPYVPDFLEECLPPDELIATARGLVPIKDVREDDMVLTHLGNLRPVTSIITRPYTGTLLNIKTPYWYKPLRLTPEHPVLRAKVIRGRKRRKLEGMDGEHITERGFVPVSELREGDYLCYPIQRDEVDVETVIMSYTKEYGAFRNSIRTPERSMQAQALRVRKQNIPLLRKQRRLLEQLVSRQQWTLDEVCEICSDLFRHEAGLVRALTCLCEKEFLLRVGRARYLVTDKGRKVAAEPYMTLQKLAHTLNTSRSTVDVERMLNPPNLRHSMQIEVSVNVELMRLVGYYLAEGSVANTTQNGKEGYYNVVELSFGLIKDKEEQGFAEDVCRAAESLGFGALVSTKQGCWHVVINSRHLAHWLTEEFGSGARNKGIPSWVIALPPVKIRPLLEAYLAGEGYFRGYQRTGTTVSLQLAYGIAQLANRIGWRASIARSMQDVNRFKKRALGTSHQRAMRAIYRVTCYENTGRDVFSNGGYLYLPVRSITREEYVGTVHNLAIDDDESYCVGYHVVHNCRRYGASRRLNPNLDLSLLSRSSRMILAHPLVINTAWQEQRPPKACKKEVPGHNTAIAESDVKGEVTAGEAGEETFTRPFLNHIGNGTESLLPMALPDSPQTGPCLFKLWELIPREAAQTVIDLLDSEVGEQHPDEELLPLCLRQIGSTIYQYRPKGESADGLVPGIFAVLPITGFALIRYQDGSVNERAREKILAGLETHGSHALPVYETDS